MKWYCFPLFHFVCGGIWLSHGVAYLCRQAKWIGAWIQWMLKLWLQYSCESRSRSSHVWTGTMTEFSFFIGEVEGRAQKTTQKCTWKQRSKKIEPNFFSKTFNNLVEQSIDGICWKGNDTSRGGGRKINAQN